MIEIEGVERLHGAEHTVIPDRIEAGSLMVAAAITGGDVLVRGAPLEHLEAVIAKLKETGATVDAGRRTACASRAARRFARSSCARCRIPDFPPTCRRR